MPDTNKILTLQTIQERIYNIRGRQVMLDSDLAEMYGVTTKVLNQAVKRNIDRFPDNFRFQLTQKEFDDLKSQSVTSKTRGGRRYLPFVFTEHGVSMLSAVLRSETAVMVSIRIIEAFVEMKRFLNLNAGLLQRLELLETKQSETDKKIDLVFKALEEKRENKNYGIYFDGQIFDAYVFVSDLIRSVKKSIVLIDNYVDETTLKLFAKRNKNVSVTIYTKNITNVLKQDVEKFNAQYPEIKLFHFDKAHDRFLIIDDAILYHIGASLKDLGKKWFAFSKWILTLWNYYIN